MLTSAYLKMGCVILCLPKNGWCPGEADLIVGGVHDVHPGVDEVLPLLLVLDALHPPVEVALVVVDVR
jgi:hypothetical protein